MNKITCILCTTELDPDDVVWADPYGNLSTMTGEPYCASCLAEEPPTNPGLTRCIDCGIGLASGEICQPCQNARLAPVCGDCLYPVAAGCNCADK